MKKIHLTTEVEKALIQIADAAERYLGSRIFSPIWDLVIKAVIEEIEEKLEQKE
jgi:hypothetical protein